MNTKTLCIAAGLALAGCLIAGSVMLSRHRTEKKVSRALTRTAAAVASDTQKPATPKPPSSTGGKPRFHSNQAGGQIRSPAKTSAPGNFFASTSPKIGDPAARDALSLVGIDPAAEQCWIRAINNPDLSEKERRNLIEDLNEDGFPDPRHPTEEDLPLIINRLRLIEVLSESAMDEVNAEAFREAYKDLANMYVRLTE